jgi:hypothetical protein
MQDLQIIFAFILFYTAMGYLTYYAITGRRSAFMVHGPLRRRDKFLIGASWPLFILWVLIEPGGRS